MRPCRAGDIALLAPTGTNLWIYERALEQREILIASQAGKSFYTRQEVQDMIAVARAIADRRDTLARKRSISINFGACSGNGLSQIGNALDSLGQARSPA
jgi:ATP-dependent exoDNAse (exonuclease V) beta subunit